MVDFVSKLKCTKSLSGLEAMINANSDISIMLIGSNSEQYQSIIDKFCQHMSSSSRRRASRSSPRKN
jgi:hypothetical protein